MPIPNKSIAIRHLLSGPQVAEIIGTSPKTLPIWRHTGRVDLPYIKIGRKVMYRPEDVEAFLERNRREHTSSTEPEQA